MITVANFEVKLVRYVDAAGTAVAELPNWTADHDLLRSLYRAMVLTRTFDSRAVSLQRTGRLGTFASSLGQEAVMVGMAFAMKETDVLLPSFREQGAQIVRGVRMHEILLYWGGDERGSDFEGPREDFPICVPVGSHASHGAGVALAFKLRAQSRVAVCSFGDGATSKGDVYEAMNFAGVHRLPLVFVVNNNQWAISVPRTRQSAASTLAQKAIGCGFDGIQVDGNDIIAVREVVRDAIEKARSGGGPTLVEALSYRLGDHTTADDASRYRDDDEVSQRWKEEPIVRFRTFLQGLECWSKADEEGLIEQCQRDVDEASQRYLDTPAQSPLSMFDHLYEALPRAYGGQREWLAAQSELLSWQT